MNETHVLVERVRDLEDTVDALTHTLKRLCEYFPTVETPDLEDESAEAAIRDWELLRRKGNRP